MSYGSQTRNPHEHTEQDESTPVTCRGCQAYLADADRITPQDGQAWNGWWWCLDCYYKLFPVVEDLARSHRMDEARDEFNERRR